MSYRLSKEQKQELERIHEKYKCTCGVTNDWCKCEVQINHGTECKKCGFDFDDVDEDYIVDDVVFPIVTGFQDCEGDQAWNENHKCPNCKDDYFYRNGN